MAQDGFGLAVLTVLADARAQHLCADQRADAANHVHRRGAGEIVEAHLRQPAAAPDPMAGHRVDEQRDRRGIDAIGGELRALGHRPGHDGGRRGAEHRLEDGEGPDRHARGQRVGVVLHDEGVDPAEGRRARAEHDAEAEQPVQRRADAEVHQVLHQDNTSAAPSSTQIVFTAENVIEINLLCSRPDRRKPSRPCVPNKKRKGGGEIALAAHPCACSGIAVILFRHRRVVKKTIC